MYINVRKVYVNICAQTARKEKDTADKQRGRPPLTSARWR